MITENVDIPRDDRSRPGENTDVQRVMIILIKILSEFRHLSVKNKPYSSNLYSVLEVLKTTILLGFWRSINDLKGLLSHLLRVCSCKQEFSEQPDDDHQHHMSGNKKSTLGLV